MKKIIINILFLLPFFMVAKAQDLQNLNNYFFEKDNFNSSYIASDSNELNVSTVISIANAVEKNNKFHFIISGNIGKLGLGIGAKVNTSFHSIYQTTSAEIILAKKINFGKGNSMSFGLNSGVLLNTLRQDRINEYTDLQDPVITENYYNKVGFTAGLGLKYNWKDKYELGVSTPFLVNTFEGVDPVYVVNTSYRQYFGKNFSLKPELVLYGNKYVTPTFEGNATFDYKNLVWVKVGGRLTEQVFFGAGGNVKFMEFAYMYNMSFGNYFKQIYPNSHNISVKFNFLEKAFQKKKEKEEVVIE